MVMSEDICASLGIDPVESEPMSKIGIAIQSLAQRPIHGLRHPAEGDTNGWYIWCGEYSEVDDFFQPVHTCHLPELLPQVLKYLPLPPGYRFLVDDNGYEDVWYDETLLNT